jgi:excisionase family DNA binding protein
MRPKKIHGTTPPNVLEPEAAALLIGCSLSTLWRRHNQGLVPAVKVAGRTRFRREDVLRYLEPRAQAK